MNRTTGTRQASRGVILVATRSALFAEIVGGMISDSGFAPAHWVDAEPVWLSVTRTQPCAVVCDCHAPRDEIERLLEEASARRLPVLLSRSDTGDEFDPVLCRGQRLDRFTFPLTGEAFQATLDGLMRAVPSLEPSVNT